MASKRFKSFHRRCLNSPENEALFLASNKLCWRQPKDESLSDWTIIVKVGDKQTTYNVHKVILGVGPKRSMYFAKIFRSKEVQEAHSKTSEISLEPSSAEAFNVMLDYMYSKDDRLDINTENATALRYLADYFYIYYLIEKVDAFIESDVILLNLSMYLEQARLYHDEPLVCGLFSALGASGCDSEILSCKIAQYLQDQGEEVSSKVFHSITAYETICKILPEYAMFFLSLSDKYPCDKNDQSKESLQSRCAEAFSRKTNLSTIFNETDENKLKEENMTEYNTLSNRTRVKFLEEVIHNQSEEMKAMEEVEFVHVFGAGVDGVYGLYSNPVNGIYFLNEKIIEGCRSYTKKGIWKDEHGSFVIHNAHAYWAISFWPNGNNSEEKQIYKSLVANEAFDQIEYYTHVRRNVPKPPPTIKRYTLGSIFHASQVSQ